MSGTDPVDNVIRPNVVKRMLNKIFGGQDGRFSQGELEDLTPAEQAEVDDAARVRYGGQENPTKIISGERKE